ncbi:MAG: prepilin-type N-terminal cleavage/methylation domain-containing protein [Candidatus Sumerlaeia bacterium]|nr:prepilin-type N-terminal cleavage/methylation domain-containing protein [Candidatus Sumerlaeia bacterium]
MRFFNPQRIVNGFTLLETIIAVLIFSVVISSIYMSFRIGTRAYKASDEKNVLLQEARFAFQSLERDLQSIYYKPETMYNLTIRQKMERLEYLRQLAEEQGVPIAEFIEQELRKERKKTEDEKDKEKNEEENLLDPYTYGIPIDLKFIGADNGTADSLEFVRYQYNDGIVVNNPWSLERVRYYVQNKQLFRESNVVFQAPRDKDGNPVETPKPPAEVISRGVEAFDIKYGFFFKQEWLEADDWHSEQRRHRNPIPQLDPEDPEYERKMAEANRKPADWLPAYVLIKLQLVDNEQSGRKMNFQTLIRLPSALENTLPLSESEEEELARNK